MVRSINLPVALFVITTAFLIYHAGIRPFTSFEPLSVDQYIARIWWQLVGVVVVWFTADRLAVRA